MSTNPQPNARVVGAPPIPTSNPAGDVVVTPRGAAARPADEKDHLVSVLMRRLRAVIDRARPRTHA